MAQGPRHLKDSFVASGVRFTPQTLSSTQKTQARENIGVSDFYDGNNLETGNTLKFHDAGETLNLVWNQESVDELFLTLTLGGVGTERFLNLNGDVTLGGAAPASAGATGVAGTITWDTGFIYICTATNTWKRVAIATW